jgi:hypothetical protein
MDAQQPGDQQEPAASVDPTELQASRRRMLRRSLTIAAPAVVTMASTSVMGSTGPLCVPASSFASINAGTSRKPQSGNPCAGLSPGGWKNRDATQWPSPYKPTDLFKDRFTRLGPYSATDTLLSVLSMGGGDDLELGRHIVATVLNAQAGLIPATIFTAAGAVALWDGYVQAGSKFYPSSPAMTPVWGHAEVTAWLKAMMV